MAGKIVLRPVPAPTGNAQQDAINLAQFEINAAAEDAANGTVSIWNPSEAAGANMQAVLGKSDTATQQAANAILNAATSAAGPIQTLMGKLNLPTTTTQAMQAVGAKAPPVTPANPTGARTIFGLPVIDVAAAAAVVVGGFFFFRKSA